MMITSNPVPKSKLAMQGIENQNNISNESVGGSFNYSSNSFFRAVLLLNPKLKSCATATNLPKATTKPKT